MDFLTRLLGIDELQGVPSTLLIPLVARAWGAKVFPALDPQDRFAQAALKATCSEVHTSPADQPTLVNVLCRMALIKQLGRDFFVRHPDSPGIDSGAGLAHHFQWLSSRHNSWLDVDLPEVITLRQSLLRSAQPCSRHQSADLTHPGWWQRLALPPQCERKPVLLICEGVLMYLQPSQVRQIVREMADNARKTLNCWWISCRHWAWPGAAAQRIRDRRCTLSLGSPQRFGDRPHPPPARIVDSAQRGRSLRPGGQLARLALPASDGWPPV